MHILMATMKLDIGGAETHIIELSKALKKRGIEITVASNGGAYEAELEEAGINHVKIPFHSKSPSCMYTAYKLLRDLIFKEKFDVVHAHARIPAFLCSLLNRRYHFRFVTTAHWVFSTRFPYNLLTRWGDRSLAVSDDIKKYLIDSYGIQGDNIRVTINGIDLEKFSKDVDYSKVAEEFSFGENKTRIVYVSRMDESRSLAAHKLIEAVPDIYKQFENLEVVIVGGGDDFDKVYAEAEAVNSALGKKIIITTGSRTDINRFAAAADLFVGVSRAALEAMACEKPSIIAGNEGYIGIFDQDKLSVSIDTNFCCRGCGETETETLKADIIKVLSASPEEKARLGAYSRDTVAKYYSIDTMANDAIKMYVSVIKDTLINNVSESEIQDIDKYMTFNPLRKKSISSDVVISGYYGFGNSGDDSILYAIIRELKALHPSIRIVTLSNTPKKTSLAYGVDSIHRFNLFSILRRIKNTKLVISGGGSLIQDVTSNKSLNYYLLITKLANVFGKKSMLYANGIGPVNNSQNIEKVRKALNKVDLITLREPSSKNELTRFGVSNPEIIVTADPAFNLFPASEDETNAVLTRSGIKEDVKYCVIAIRPWRTSDSDFSLQLAQAANYAKEKYDVEAVFILMQPTNDSKISFTVANEINSKAIVIEEPLTPSQALGIISKAEFVIGMRLHALIYAAKCATPVIGIVYDPKIEAMMDYMGQTLRVPTENPNPITLCRYIDEIMQNKSEISEKLAEISTKASENASNNAKLALNLIGYSFDTTEVTKDA